MKNKTLMTKIAALGLAVILVGGVIPETRVEAAGKLERFDTTGFDTGKNDDYYMYTFADGEVYITNDPEYIERQRQKEIEIASGWNQSLADAERNLFMKEGAFLDYRKTFGDNVLEGTFKGGKTPLFRVWSSMTINGEKVERMLFVFENVLERLHEVDALYKILGVSFVEEKAYHETVKYQKDRVKNLDIDIEMVNPEDADYAWKYGEFQKAGSNEKINNPFTALYMENDPEHDVIISYWNEKLGITDTTAPSTTTGDNMIYRAFNKYDGDHIYTMSVDELNALLETGQWEKEKSPGKSTPDGVPVYGFKNKLTGEHLYTSDERECKALVAGDWTYENGGKPIFYGSKNPTNKAVYRLFNPGTTMPKAAHHYTNDPVEIRVLKANGYQVDNKEKPMYYL